METIIADVTRANPTSEHNHFSDLCRVYPNSAVVVLHREDQDMDTGTWEPRGLKFQVLRGVDSENCLHAVKNYLSKASAVSTVITWHKPYMVSKAIEGKDVFGWKDWENKYLTKSTKEPLHNALRKASIELLTCEVRQVLYQKIKDAVGDDRTLVKVASHAARMACEQLNIAEPVCSQEQAQGLICQLLSEVPVLLDNDCQPIWPTWKSSGQPVQKVDEDFEKKLESAVLMKIIRIRGHLPLAATREVAEVLYANDDEDLQQKVADLGRYLLEQNLVTESTEGLHISSL